MRLRPRPTDVFSTLLGFAITTFEVDADALDRELPKGLSAERFEMDDGRARALVSAVTFRNVDFHVGFAPFVRLVAEQTNFRAYVRRGEARAVWFFGTTLGSRSVAVPRHLWRLPWAFGEHACSFDFDASGRCASYRWRARSSHGEEHLEARGTGAPTGVLEGFPDEASTVEILTHPVVGYLRRTDGRVATYGVEHETLRLERAEASVARFELFERRGLVAPGQRPHSVLVMPRTEFVVRLPPRCVELG